MPSGDGHISSTTALLFCGNLPHPISSIGGVPSTGEGLDRHGLDTMLGQQFFRVQKILGLLLVTTRKGKTMVARVSAFLLLTLVGCGGTTPAGDTPDMEQAPLGAGFVGTWTGPTTYDATTCSNGQMLTATTTPSQTYVISLVSNGDVSWTGDCGAFDFAPLLGPIATQNGIVTCPPSVSNGFQTINTAKGGQLEILVAGATMSFTFTEDSAISGGSSPSFSCESSAKATLTKQ
jgi:hypothetical protein